MKDVILTGPKHSGKTSAGKALALLCSRNFIDLDELIIQRTGKNARQLYNEDPQLFKKTETHIIYNCIKDKNFVIAAGGGIIDNPDAIAILIKSGIITVYLNISAGTAWKRINNSLSGELPSFLKTENPQETHRILHERRVSAYLQIADMVIEAEGKTPEEIALEIKELLQ
jgi:shikimate kinase